MSDKPQRLWWLTLVDRLTGSGTAGIELGAQFRSQMPLYVVGAVMLLAQQVLMAARDFLVKDSIDAISQRQSDEATMGAAMILAVSVGAMAPLMAPTPVALAWFS